MSTLALRIKVLGQSQAQGEVKQFAGSMDVVTSASQRLRQGLQDAGASASMTERNVRALTSGSSEGLSESATRAKQFGSALIGAAKDGAEAWTGMQFSIGGVISKIKEARDQLDDFRKKAGTVMIAGGVAQGAVVGNAVQNAGQVQGVKGALETNLKGSGMTVEEMMEQLKEFDADSQLDFLESAKTANRLVAKGFDPREVDSIMRTLGDATGAQMGTQEDFDGMARALAQIKSRGKGQYSSEEGNQLAERGINANAMISKATGVSEGDIQSGNHEISADVALKAILEGMKKFEGGMASAAATLPGKIATLQGAIFQMNAAIGEYLLPPIIWMIGGITKLVTAFNNLPAPIHAIIGYSMAFNSGLLMLVGTLLIFAPPLLSLWGTFKILGKVIPFVNGFLGVFGTSAGKLALQLGSKLLPLLSGSGGLIPGVSTLMGALSGLASFMAVALPLAIAVGVGLMMKAAIEEGVKARNKLTESEDPGEDLGDARTNEGALKQAADLERRASGLDPRIKKMQEQVDAPWYLRDLSALTTPTEDREQLAGMKAEQQSLRADADRLRRQAANALSASNLAATTAATAAADPNLPMATIAGVASAGGDPQIDSLQSEIYSLQDQLRSADKDAKPALRDALVAKQRAMKALRARVSDENKIANAEERAQKKAERLAEHEDKQYQKDSIDNEQLEYDVRETETEEGFNTRIAQLEAERDAAKEAKNEAKEAALEFEIDKLNAERDYALAKIRADATGLENEKKADAMMRIAETKKRGALARAAIEFNAAKGKGLDKLRSGGVLPGLPAGLATRGMEAAANGGGMFNPYANMAGESGGGSTPFARMIRTPDVAGRTAADFARNMRSAPREWVTQGRLQTDTAANGKVVLRVIIDDKEIENPVAAMGGRI